MSKQQSKSRWENTKVPVWYKREKMAPEDSILFQVIKEAYYNLNTGRSKEAFIEYFSLPESSIPRGEKGTQSDLTGQYCDLANEIVKALSCLCVELPAPDQKGDEYAETYGKEGTS